MIPLWSPMIHGWCIFQALFSRILLMIFVTWGKECRFRPFCWRVLEYLIGLSEGEKRLPKKIHPKHRKMMEYEGNIRCIRLLENIKYLRQNYFKALSDGKIASDAASVAKNLRQTLHNTPGGGHGFELLWRLNYTDSLDLLVNIILVTKCHDCCCSQMFTEGTTSW